MSRPPERRGSTTLSTVLPHLVAVFWVAALALVLLTPALVHGTMIGPYDLIGHMGLTARAGNTVRGSYVVNDGISQMIPWANLNWTEIHHGVLPLWDPYNGLGLPLAFNWQAASFSLPSLVSYLFPLRDAYTVSVFVTLLVAGTGAYVLGRVLSLGFLGAVTAATIFELCGPLVVWLGFPLAQVMAWGGWVFAAAALVVRGRRRVWPVALLAVTVAETIYAGHPETAIVMLLALVLFVGVLLASRLAPRRLGFAGGPVARPAVGVLTGVVAGMGLAAPLLLPALQLTAGSIRSTSAPYTSLPAHVLLYYVFSSFDGVPVSGTLAFGPAYFYNQTAAYVGVVAIALALIGAVAGIRRRSAATLGLLLVLAAALLVAYVGPVTRVADTLPFVGHTAWLRAQMPAGLALAVLAGMGMGALVKEASASWMRWTFLLSFAGCGLLVGGLWLVGRGGGLPAFGHSTAAHVRAESFLWPTIGVAAGIVAAVLVWWRSSWVRVAAVGLLACETGFLMASGTIQISSSADGAPPTAAVSALGRVAGSSLVGAGAPAACELGVVPDANILYGIHELNAYDPIVPKAYFQQWSSTFGTPAGRADYNLFCPVVTTVTEARALGVGYVLEAAGHPGPPGTTPVELLRVPDPYPRGALFRHPPPDEVLYRVPGTAAATLTSLSPSGLPPPLATGRPVHVRVTGPRTRTITTGASTPTVLRLHLTDVPGWHATIDGRPLALRSYLGFMLQARIPPGHHRIELAYWPTTFTLGILIAAGCALVLVGALVLDLRRRRRRPTGGRAPRLDAQPGAG